MNDAWVWPGPEPYHWWPDHLPRDGSLEVLVRFFGEAGYSLAATDDGFSPSFERVAIFGDEEGPTHAALELPDGSWTSKLGMSEDIRHADLGVLTGYGPVVALLRRPWE